MNYKTELHKITTFVFDVDGVLTDGSVMILPGQEPIRTFNAKDGYALQLAVRKGFRVAIITGGKSEAAKELVASAQRRAEAADRLQRAVDMRAGLGVQRDDIGAGIDEGADQRVDRADHQMYIERLVAMRPQRLHDGRADCQVGHEMPVHHIDMDPVGTGVGNRAHLVAETGEIGGQD